MNIFSTRKDLKERIDVLESRLAETEAAMVEAAAANEESAEALKAKDAELASLTERIDAAESEALTLKEKLAEAEAALNEAKAKDESFDERVNDRATQVLAAAGHPPVEMAEEASVDVLATFDKLTGAERTRFYRANEAAIKAAIRAS